MYFATHKHNTRSSAPKQKNTKTLVKNSKYTELKAETSTQVYEGNLPLCKYQNFTHQKGAKTSDNSHGRTTAHTYCTDTVVMLHRRTIHEHWPQLEPKLRSPGAPGPAPESWVCKRVQRSEYRRKWQGWPEILLRVATSRSFLGIFTILRKSNRGKCDDSRSSFPMINKANSGDLLIWNSWELSMKKFEMKANKKNWRLTVLTVSKIPLIDNKNKVTQN